MRVTAAISIILLKAFQSWNFNLNGKQKWPIDHWILTILAITSSVIAYLFRMDGSKRRSDVTGVAVREKSTDKMETRAQLRKCAAGIGASRILNDGASIHGIERAQGKGPRE